MSRQFEQMGQTHLMEWADIGYQCRTTLSAGRVHIRLWPCGQEWSPWCSVQGWALPGRAPEFYPPLSGPDDSPAREAVRRSLEALEELRSGAAGVTRTASSLKPAGLSAAMGSW